MLERGDWQKKEEKEKSYGNQERGLWEKICLSIPPEPYDTSSPIIWPDWRWSPSYILTLGKSLPVSLHSLCPTQSHSVSIEKDSHTSSLLFLLDSAEPVPFPFVPHLYSVWGAHRKKETILCPLIFTHFPKPTETFHTMSINWFCSSPRLLDIWAQAIYRGSLHTLKSVCFTMRETLIWLHWPGHWPGHYAQRASEKFISECTWGVATRHTASMDTHTQFSRIYTWTTTLLWCEYDPQISCWPVCYTHVQCIYMHMCIYKCTHAYRV